MRVWRAAGVLRHLRCDADRRVGVAEGGSFVASDTGFQPRDIGLLLGHNTGVSSGYNRSFQHGC